MKKIVIVVVLLITVVAAVYLLMRPSPASEPVALPEQTPAPAPLAPPAPQANAAYQRGPAGAPILLEEYSDYECPFCAQTFLKVSNEIEMFVKNRGNIRYSFVDLAGPGHAQALTAASAARCAGAQISYHDVQRTLFERQDEWKSKATTPVPVIDIVSPLVPNRDALVACVENQLAPVEQILAANLQRALDLGVTKTPTFVLWQGGMPRVLGGSIDTAKLAAAMN